MTDYGSAAVRGEASQAPWLREHRMRLGGGDCGLARRVVQGHDSSNVVVVWSRRAWARHLTADQILAVSCVAIAMNAFNRVSILSRHPVRPDRTPRPTQASDRPEPEREAQ
jgi:hypothetical protein